MDMFLLALAVALFIFMIWCSSQKMKDLEDQSNNPIA